MDGWVGRIKGWLGEMGGKVGICGVGEKRYEQ